jgi:hypothetical protein
MNEKLSRRKMFVKYGSLAASLPLITTLVAPFAINEASFSGDCTTLPMPFPSGCQFGSTATSCPVCTDTLVSVTATVCESGSSSISTTCPPNPTNPALVDCTGTCN